RLPRRMQSPRVHPRRRSKPSMRCRRRGRWRLLRESARPRFPPSGIHRSRPRSLPHPFRKSAAAEALQGVASPLNGFSLQTNCSRPASLPATAEFRPLDQRMEPSVVPRKPWHRKQTPQENRQTGESRNCCGEYTASVRAILSPHNRSSRLSSHRFLKRADGLSSAGSIEQVEITVTCVPVFSTYVHEVVTKS